MRRLAVIPLALLLGCWDFDSLSGTYVPPVVDASAPGDIACAKTPNTLQEDCTQNIDINNNCLYGCEDPTCYDHVACFASKGYKTYGSVKPNVAACPTQSMSSTIYQNIVTPPNCNGQCSCSAGTCSSTLHVYSDNACTMNEVKVAIAEGAGKCPAVTSTAMSSYKLDAPAAGGCTASGSGNLSVNWQTTNALCDQGSSKLVRFTDMKSNGVSCVVFSGTDTSVCATTKVFPQGAVWYTGSSGASSCACSCTGPTGGCTLGNGEVRLDDQDMCKGNQMFSEIKTAATCVQAKDMANNPYQVKGVATSIPAPTCGAPAGAVNGNFLPTGGFTVCCQ